MYLSDEKEMYLLLSKMSAYKNKIKKAKEILDNALKNSTNTALSFSSGKDSIVLLHLAVQTGFKGTLVFFKYGLCTDIETPKENIELLKYYAELYGLKYKILECLGEADCWEQIGRFVIFPTSDREKSVFNKTNFDYVIKSKKFEEENNIDLSIIGMRKDESRHRKLMLNKNGPIYQTKSRSSVTCCPISIFSNDDIWAYIFSNDLKYLSIYDYPYIDRRFNRNEITLLYNDSIVRHGGTYHYRKMYPDFFNWIKDRWGDVFI